MIDIAALAKQTGIPAHTLRYYETRGLIAPREPQWLKAGVCRWCGVEAAIDTTGAASGHVFGRHQCGLWFECRHGGEAQRFSATSSDSGLADSTIANRTNFITTLASVSAWAAFGLPRIFGFVTNRLARVWRTVEILRTAIDIQMQNCLDTPDMVHEDGKYSWDSC